MYYLSVSMVQGFSSSLSGWLHHKVSLEVWSDRGQGHSYPKAQLGLEVLFPKWLSHLADTVVLDVGCTLSLSGLFECPYNMVVAFPPEQVMPEREQDRDWLHEELARREQSWEGFRCRGREPQLNSLDLSLSGTRLQLCLWTPVCSLSALSFSKLII